jgi:septal ring factor EnvC (AmiA/AmiB activator)
MVEDLESMAARVEAVVDDLKAAKDRNKELLKAKKRLEERVASLEREIGRSQKEGKRAAELLDLNKTYKKNFTLMKTRVSSMLAKIEGLQ